MVSLADRVPPWVFVLMRLPCTRPPLDVLTDFSAPLPGNAHCQGL